MTALRALAALAMLVGFYVLAIGIVIALGVTTVWAFTGHAATAGVKLGVATFFVAFALVAALWKVARAERERPTGVALSEQAAPELWREVREIAGVAGTRAPDEIRLVPEVNAAVSEDTRLMGLIGGRRTLVIGVPLILGVSRDQLRSVLAHELGHYSKAHTRLAPVTYRGRQAIGATVQELSGNIVGWLLMQWGKLYLLVSAAVSRSQEREADLLSARVVGPSTAQGALREVEIVDAAWDFYLEGYVSTGWEDGLAPEPGAFFDGFAHLLAARAGELDGLRGHAPSSEKSRWDSHPPLAERIAALGAAGEPDGPNGPATASSLSDSRPASSLFPTLTADAARLAEETVDYAERTRLPWDRLIARAMPARDQHVADILFRAVARVTGTPKADLGALLAVAATDRFDAVRHDLLPVDVEDADDQVASAVEAALRCAAVRSAVASWRLSWSDSARLERSDGTELDLAPLARKVLSPASAPEVAGDLAALGIDVGAGVQVATTPDARGAQILGGLANVKVDGAPHDVLVLDVGLVVAPCPKSTDGGKGRLLAFAQAAPASRLAAEHTFIAYEQIAAARIVKQVPVRIELTLHDGRALTLHEAWSGEQLTKDSRDLLLSYVAPYARVG